MFTSCAVSTCNFSYHYHIHNTLAKKTKKNQKKGNSRKKDKLKKEKTMVFKMLSVQLLLERLRRPIKTTSTANKGRPINSPVLATGRPAVFTSVKPPRPRSAHPRRQRTAPELAKSSQESVELKKEHLANEWKKIHELEEYLGLRPDSTMSNVTTSTMSATSRHTLLPGAVSDSEDDVGEEEVIINTRDVESHRKIEKVKKRKRITIRGRAALSSLKRTLNAAKTKFLACFH
ncbi:uncharacterized protein LOC134820721 [Bolinopsis microptera]|uniref:uncharacterized protein LOC134820721 n=1 Tax=Bolinopsis microptera TaxID=2820187 RepID=UPI00307A99AB